MAEESSKKPINPRPVETGKIVENSAEPIKRPIDRKPQPKNIKEK